MDLANRLLTAVEPGQFARLPSVGGQVIHTNHPCFILGHLSLYPSKILAMCGRDAAPATPPDGFDTLFRRDSLCRDDPHTQVYPSMAVVTEAFFRNYDAVLTAIPSIPVEILAQPNPDPRLAQTFPTVGFAVFFLLANHTATHLGQISVWRRCMGLGPA